MSSIRILSISFGILFSLTWTNPADADEFGVIMDVTGKVAIQREKSYVKADLGVEVKPGDIIKIEKGANIVLVSYLECNEWSVNGPDTVTIKNDGLDTQRTKVIPTRQLPVCYGPEEFKTGDDDVMGGFVLRGAPKDPLASLRQEFASGKASSSTLMTLIMHDLKRGNADKARSYYEELKKRSPDSSFVKKITPRF